MTGRGKRDRTQRTRVRAGTGALGALMMLAVSVCGVVPTGSQGAAASGTASTGTVSTVAASSSSASGGGRTYLADDSQCTTQKDGAKLASSQSAPPWETTFANTQGSGLTGKGVKVAVIDSGIAGGNSQLNAHIVGGQDFTQSGGVYKADVDGHGTLVTSIIAAQSSSKNGMVGIAPGVDLLIYREAGCNVKAGSDEATMAAAIDAAVAAGAQIINISQDGYIANAKLRAAVVNAYKNNVLIVASAGNYGSSQASQNNTNYGINPVMYPASYAPYLLAVGAATADGGVAPFSETGPYIGVIAPGVQVGGLFPSDGKIWTDDGTSFAAPYVAGVAALMIEKHPTWTVGTIMKVIEATASGGGKWTKSAGWGLVDANVALSADPATVPRLYGAGPNADGPSAARPVTHGISMAPIVAVAEPQAVVDQRRGAYLAVGAALLVVLVMVAGTIIARDARRRVRRQ